MTIKIRKTNLRRLASLSALGAGALGATAGTGEASTIVYSGIVDEKVGWGAGYGRRATIAGPNGVDGILHLGSRGCPTLCASIWTVGLSAHNGPHGTNFRFLDTSYGVNVAAFPLSLARLPA